MDAAAPTLPLVTTPPAGEDVALLAAGVPAGYLGLAPAIPRTAGRVERLVNRAARSRWAEPATAVLATVALLGVLTHTLHPTPAPPPTPVRVAGYVAAMDALVRPPNPAPAVPHSLRYAEALGVMEDADLTALRLAQETTTTTTTTTTVPRRPAHPPTTLPRRGAPTVTAPRAGGVDWDGIARCETGGNWSMQGPRFSGGLGFYNGAWNDFGGREFAPNAGQASREAQIVVAERIYARHGLSGWGCRAYG